MTSKPGRLYDDDEVREIFKVASTTGDPGDPTRSSATGLSLTQLQDIGREVGLSPEAVTRAAHGLDHAVDLADRRRVLGVPVGVARRFALGRKVSAEEWDRLVLTLRSTFHAPGKTQTAGSLREWWNGNLRVTLEPSQEGDVIHLSSSNSASEALFRMGAAMTALAAATILVFSLTGQLADKTGPLMLLLVGIGQIAFGALRLPGWLSRRARQFEAIGASVMNPQLTAGSEQAED